MHPALLAGIVVLGVALNSPGGQRGSVSEHDMVEGHARGARQCRVTGHGDLVARLEGLPCKSGTGHLVRIPHLSTPVGDSALVVGHIEEKTTVGIGPEPAGDSAL